MPQETGNFHKKSSLFDAFLKLDNVKGESQDDKHKGEIDILSWSWNVENQGTGSHGGGSGAGKVKAGDLHFVKHVDNATTTLYQNCCTGEHLKSGVLTLRKAGKNPLEYLIIKMNDVLVTSITALTHEESPVPIEEVSLNFAKFSIDYKEQKADGSGGPTSNFAYDLKANKTA